jgi:four helix bundle protein
MASSFRDLVTYRLAVALADDVHSHVRGWPSLDRWSSGIQLIRAVDSVGANIAEADGRWNTPDRRRLLMIARGSLYETEHWMLRAEARGLLPTGASERVDEIARTLNGLIKRPAPHG